MRSEDTFPKELLGSVWHTTSISRYKLILEEGAILPNPPIPDAERWKTKNGERTWPYVRVLGGVSLFDFVDFNPIGYGNEYPLSSWNTFVPYRRDWGESVWIKIDHKQLNSAFIHGTALLERWRNDEQYSNTIMPKIEAASLSAVPISSFVEVLVSSAACPTLTVLESRVNEA